MSDRPETIHASAVAVSGRGVLIRGASGSGKSSFALALLSRGGRLVADDRTVLARRGDHVLAWAPRATLGLLEARFVGIFDVEPAPPTRLLLAVDLDRTESERLPPLRGCDILGVRLPLVLGAGNPHVVDAVFLWLTTGARRDP